MTTEWLPADRPLLAAAVRALPAGLVLTLASRSVPRGVWLPRMAVLGTLNIGAFFALLFVAAYRLPGGVAALIGSVQPLVMISLSVLLLRTRTTLAQLGAGALGAVGVSLLVLRSASGLDPVGVAAALAATRRWRPASC